MMLLFHPVAIHLGMKFLTLPFPSWEKMGTATLFFLFMEDFYQYFAHRLLHWGILYKKIHKQHHEYSAPFGLASQYAHPLETLFLGIGFFVGPLIWVSVTKDLHVITMAFWLAIRLLQVVDAHSGYDFPWVIFHFPFLNLKSLYIISYLFGQELISMIIIIWRLWVIILLHLDGGIGYVELQMRMMLGRLKREMSRWIKYTFKCFFILFCMSYIFN